MCVKLGALPDMQEGLGKRDISVLPSLQGRREGWQRAVGAGHPEEGCADSGVLCRKSLPIICGRGEVEGRCGGWRPSAWALAGPACALIHFLILQETQGGGDCSPLTASAPEAQRLLGCRQGSFKPQPTSARSWSPLVGRRGVRQVRQVGQWGCDQKDIGKPRGKRTLRESLGRCL